MKKKDNACRLGTRHLRVVLELGKETRVAAVWPVDKPLVPLDRLAGDLAIRVDVPGVGTHVETVEDPRLMRGAYRDKRGHSFLVDEGGRVEVSVPFVRFDDLRDVRVRLADLRGLESIDRDRDGMIRLFDDPPSKLGEVIELGTPHLQAHPNWNDIPGLPGAGEPECRYEIYRDGKGWRFRLVRAGGGVVAVSACVYGTRDECARDLAWVRRCACNAKVVPADLRGGGDKSGEPSVKDHPSEPREPEKPGHSSDDPSQDEC